MSISFPPTVLGGFYRLPYIHRASLPAVTMEGDATVDRRDRTVNIQSESSNLTKYPYSFSQYDAGRPFSRAFSLFVNSQGPTQKSLPEHVFSTRELLFLCCGVCLRIFRSQSIVCTRIDGGPIYG